MLATPGYHRLVREVHGRPTVSAVLATDWQRGRVWATPRTFVVGAVDGVLAAAGHPIDEWLVASTSPLPDDIAERFDVACRPGFRSIVAAGSAVGERLNRAAAEATCEYLLLLHDDVQPMTSGFLTTLLGLAQAGDVGMVGCRLLAADGTLDHAGHVYVGQPRSAYQGRGADETGWGGVLSVDREVSGVSTACALIRREVFDRVGGFSPEFVGNDRDVDLSLKVRRDGFRIVYTPHATLYHFGTTDDGPDAGSAARLHQRWDHELNHDPYHHPKLLRDRDDWAIPFGRDA
jgi:hypothetical protein